MYGKSSNFFDGGLPMDSSSEEDEVEMSSEEVDGNSSSEEEGDKSSNPETVVVEKNYASDSESDHDSEIERKELVKNPGPSAVKSVAEAEKDRSSGAKKRSSDGAAAASTDGKRVKSSDGGEETKKTYFQRVWSEDDDITVLQGIIDYKTVNGVSPFDDTNALYKVVKNSISFDVSRTQFTKKLTGLKKKFENNLGRGKNGDEPIFSKPHDRKAFDLSKLIWGANGITPQSVMKSNGKSKKVEVVSSLHVGKIIENKVTNKGKVSSLGGMVELDTTSFFLKSLAGFGVDELAAQQGWTRLASEDKKRFDEQWKVMQLKELEMSSEKSGFIHEVITKMGEASRSNP